MPAILQSAQLHLLDPNLSLPLFLLGIFLLYLEFNVPGRVLPAALGCLALVFALNALLHTPLLPWALALTLACTAAIPLTLLLSPVPNRVPHLSLLRGGLPTAATALLTYALFRLADVPNGTHHVHLITALLTATAFTVVTLQLGRIALLARRNKLIRPRAR